jgi:hypothetical protein
MAAWREARVRKELPVRIRGTDYDGNPFVQETYTVDISRRGARLEWLSSLKGAGDTIEVQRGREKARFRVVWIGDVGTPQDNQIGIRSLEPTKYIWGEPLPAPIRVDEPGQEAAPAQPAPPAAANASAEQRRRPRYRCGGAAQVWQEGAQSPQSGTLSEISTGGCFIETTWPLPIGTHIELHLKTHEVEVEVKGVVGYLDPSGGMGIVFSQVSSEAREHLQQLIDRLAARPS